MVRTTGQKWKNYLQRNCFDVTARGQPEKWPFSASSPPWKTWLAKNPTQCSCLSRSQSNVVHHSTNDTLPSVTGVTRMVAS